MRCTKYNPTGKGAITSLNWHTNNDYAVSKRVHITWRLFDMFGSTLTFLNTLLADLQPRMNLETCDLFDQLWTSKSF